MPVPHPTHPHRPRRRASRLATAVALATLTVAVGITVLLASNEPIGDAADRADPLTSFPREAGVGACLRLVEPAGVDAATVAAAMVERASAHDHLFPDAGVSMSTPSGDDPSTVVALWPSGELLAADAARRAMATGPCAARDGGWAFGATRALLADGADRLLERAELGDGWAGRIDVSFHPDETRVRTTLRFSGPLGIGGTCWIDERLGVDVVSGRPRIATDSGNEAGLAGLIACRRFESEMAAGGAGAQALALLPMSLSDDAAANDLRMHAIELDDELLIVRGSA